MLRPWLQVGLPMSSANTDELHFNKSMNSCRISVESGITDIKQQYTINDFCLFVKVQQAPITPILNTSVVLSNLKVCFHGSTNGANISSALHQRS